MLQDYCDNVTNLHTGMITLIILWEPILPMNHLPTYNLPIILVTLADHHGAVFAVWCQIIWYCYSHIVEPYVLTGNSFCKEIQTTLKTLYNHFSSISTLHHSCIRARVTQDTNWSYLRSLLELPGI